jgi:hypothetical protein
MGIIRKAQRIDENKMHAYCIQVGLEMLKFFIYKKYHPFLLSAFSNLERIMMYAIFIGVFNTVHHPECNSTRRIRFIIKIFL